MGCVYMEEIDDKANRVGRSKQEEAWWHVPDYLVIVPFKGWLLGL